MSSGFINRGFVKAMAPAAIAANNWEEPAAPGITPGHPPTTAAAAAASEVMLFVNRLFGGSGSVGKDTLGETKGVMVKDG